MVLGPTSRMSASRAMASSRSCNAASSGLPVSANPAASTITPPTPSRAHSATIGSTASRPVATTTQSGTSGSADRLGWHGRPASSRCLALTWNSRPSNAAMLATTRLPNEPGRSDTPTTATLAGAIRRAMAAAG